MTEMPMLVLPPLPPPASALLLVLMLMQMFQSAMLLVQPLRRRPLLRATLLPMQLRVLLPRARALLCQPYLAFRSHPVRQRFRRLQQQISTSFCSSCWRIRLPRPLPQVPPLRPLFLCQQVPLPVFRLDPLSLLRGTVFQAITVYSTDFFAVFPLQI